VPPDNPACQEALLSSDLAPGMQEPALAGVLEPFCSRLAQPFCNFLSRLWIVASCQAQAIIFSSAGNAVIEQVKYSLEAGRAMMSLSVTHYLYRGYFILHR
jgi:hypothetical protein